MHFEISNVLGNMSVVPKTKKKKKKDQALLIHVLSH